MSTATWCTCQFIECGLMGKNFIASSNRRQRHADAALAGTADPLLGALSIYSASPQYLLPVLPIGSNSPAYNAASSCSKPIARQRSRSTNAAPRARMAGNATSAPTNSTATTSSRTPFCLSCNAVVRRHEVDEVRTTISGPGTLSNLAASRDRPTSQPTRRRFRILWASPRRMSTIAPSLRRIRCHER